MLGWLALHLLVGAAIGMAWAAVEYWWETRPLAHRGDCAGDWYPMPSYQHPRRIRCERCGAKYGATLERRAAMERDVSLSMLWEGLQTQGRALLAAERERA
jgi:hypothetical protein